MPPLVILYHSAACGSFDDRRLPPSGVAPCILSVAVASYERRTGLTRTSSSETARDINGHLPTVVLVFIKIRKTPNFAAPRTTPPLKMHFFSSGNTRWDIPRLQHARSRYIRHDYGATHGAPMHLPVGIEGVRTHASASLLRVSAVVLCLVSNGDWRSRTLKTYLKFESSRIKLVGLGRCELLC